jgi:hypothetical protein
MTMTPSRTALAAIFVLLVANGPALVQGQQPPAPAAKAAPAPKPTAGAPGAPGVDVLDLQATSANAREPGSQVRVRIGRWSTAEERDAVVTALNTPAPPPTAAPPGAANRTAAAGGGRGGRGAGRGRGEAPNPIAGMTAAIGAAPTIGYIWTDEVTGYSIKYAFRDALPGGGDRIILATDRRLGAYTPGWQPVATTPATPYEFTLIEIRLDPKGLGEGKASLATPVVVDKDAKTVALENYAAAAAIFKNVKR